MASLLFCMISRIKPLTTFFFDVKEGIWVLYQVVFHHELGSLMEGTNFGRTKKNHQLLSPGRVFSDETQIISEISLIKVSRGWSQHGRNAMTGASWRLLAVPAK